MGRKDVAVKIRLPRGFREEFLKACRRADRPAAEVLREIMHNYTESHQHGRQQSLLPGNKQQQRSTDRSHG
jgi:predicted DNA-binding protein